MKRVGLFLASAPHFGGAFQYSQTVLNALAQLPEDQFRVVIGYAHDAWPAYLESYRFETRFIPLGYWGRFFGQLLHYGGVSVAAWRSLARFCHPTVRAFAGCNCDLWIFPSQDPWAYLAPVPALATIHDLMHRYGRRFPEAASRKEYRWREWHYANICRWSAGVLVDSKVGKEQVLESYAAPSSRVHELPFVAPCYLDGEPAPYSGAVPLPEKFLFYPAQFWEHKNHKGLIRALGLLKGRFPEIRLVCAGTAKNGYDSALRLVEELGVKENVLFLGYVPDQQMAAIYRRARAMVMPTFFGPTNIPPLEAMKLGCPAAVSAVYGMPEQTRGAALLFDPASDEEIAAAVARLWEDDQLCRTLAAKGVAASEQWTAVHFAARLAGIIREITG